MPSKEVTFDFSSGTLSEVTKAAAVIGAPDMVLEAMDIGSAVLKVTDKKNDTANSYASHLKIENAQKKFAENVDFEIKNRIKFLQKIRFLR